MDTRGNQAQTRPSDLKPRLVSIKDARAMLSVGKTFFYEQILGKELLTPVYLGGRTLIAVEDIDDLVQRLRGKAG